MSWFPRRALLCQKASAVLHSAMKRCPACTLDNEEDVLACSACGTELLSGSDELVRCPVCTVDNPKLAERCHICEATLPYALHSEWKCSACGETATELIAAAEEAVAKHAVDGGKKKKKKKEKPAKKGEEEEEPKEPIMWLPCAHRACVACHAKWIQARDEEGKEPTCLTCNASDGGDAKPLDDACIRAILGRIAHEKRAERLIDLVGFLPCPTPDCTYRVSVEDGVDARTTTCPRCRQVVVVGAASLSAMAAFPGESSSAAGSAPPLPAALPAALPATTSAVSPAAWAPPAAAAVPQGSGSADDPHCLAESDDAGDGGEGGRAAASAASAGAAGEVMTASNGGGGSDGSDGGGGGGGSDDDDDDVPLSAVAERHLKRERDEAASAEALSGSQYRQCPGCKNGLEKLRNTCNKFQCRCGCRFCWKCGALGDANGNATCRCTGSDHVFWDNEKNRPAVGGWQKKPRR